MYIVTYDNSGNRDKYEIKTKTFSWVDTKELLEFLTMLTSPDNELELISVVVYYDE